MYHVVETVDVYVCKFGICGTKFQRKLLKKNKQKKPNLSMTKLCVVFVFCIWGLKILVNPVFITIF